MKISRKQATELGLFVPQALPRQRSPADGKAKGGDPLFLQLCLAHGLPVPIPEFPFAKEIGRRWRFDYLFEGWLAIEQVGGVWVRGHHSRGQDQLDDMEKENWAVRLGYAVLRFSPQQMRDGSACAFIRHVLHSTGESA